VGRFRWLDADLVPAAYDLRRRGWTLVGCGFGPSDAAARLSRAVADGPDLVAPPHRAITLLVGVAEAERRAELLQAGFGDVLGPQPDLAEIEARAARLLALARHEPPSRRHGELELELLSREAFVSGRPVGLHPREFALLWRLMAAGGAPLGKARLLAEVWNLQHVPETNSLPVHVSRLRRKLAEVGYPALVETRQDGYAYVPPAREARPALPLEPDSEALDAHVRMTDEADRSGSRDGP
jgi:two-component system, OmpR family, response regulator